MSFTSHDPVVIVAGCFSLAAKVEECQSKISWKAVCGEMKSMENLFTYSEDYVAKSEAIILQQMGYSLLVFDVHSALGPLLVSSGLCQEEELQTGMIQRKEAQDVWRAANDSYLMTDAILLYPPHIIALGCIVFGAVVLNRQDLRWWFATFMPHPELESDMHHVWDVVNALIDGYTLLGDCTPDITGQKPWEKEALRLLGGLKIKRPFGSNTPYP